MLIQAIQGVDGDKPAGLLEDAEREFVPATFLKLELPAEQRQEVVRH